MASRRHLKPFLGRHLGFPVEEDVVFFDDSTIEKHVFENWGGADTGFMSLVGRWAKLDVYVTKRFRCYGAVQTSG